jgi:hypothetical protein
MPAMVMMTDTTAAIDPKMMTYIRLSGNVVHIVVILDI